MTPPNEQSGFTLLELLVAVAIFALIAVMSYQAIDSTVVSREVSEKRLQELAQLNQVFSLLKKDLLQTSNRPIRDEVGDHQAGMLVANNGQLLEFTHHGRIVHINPVLTTLQRTRYLLKDNKLFRERWPILDRVSDSQPTAIELLQNIEDMQIELFDLNNQTYPDWPYLDTNTGQAITHLPIGIRITIESTHYGSITRTFPLGGA